MTSVTFALRERLVPGLWVVPFHLVVTVFCGTCRFGCAAWKEIVRREGKERR